VFVGELDMSQYSQFESVEVKQFFDTLPQNCFSYFGKLQEGEEYNSVFAAIDIPFLVYENFASASNRLTKAAIFKKHVLAQDNFCVGEDVKKYGLGETVESANVQQCLKAIDSLYKASRNPSLSMGKFEQYRQLHSLSRLTKVFANLL
jgi:hypothetical protein